MLLLVILFAIKLLAQVTIFKCSGDIFFSRTFDLLLLNPLSANPTKWSNTLKTIRRQKPTNCLSVFDHFVGLALKGLTLVYMFCLKFDF